MTVQFCFFTAGTYSLVASYAGIYGGPLGAALAGGIISDLQGGNFGHGFWAAGLGSALGGNVSNNPVVNVVVSAVIGGTISKVTGGKFANGAYSAAFSAALVQDWSSSEPLVEGSPEWEAREEEYFLKEKQQMIDALNSGQDLLASNHHWLEPFMPELFSSSALQCRASCIDKYYGDLYHNLDNFGDGGIPALAARQYAKYVDKRAQIKTNHNLWGDSRTQNFNPGRRQMRTLKQFRFFTGAYAVGAVGAKSFVYTADAVCAIECWGGQ